MASVTRITLRWDAPIDLKLHVIEPGGTAGGPGDAAVGPVSAAKPLAGRIHLVDDGTGLGPFQESYVIAGGLPALSLVVAIENVSRGRVPSGEHCKNGELARVGYSLVIVDKGSVRRRSYESAPLSCGQQLDDASYYQRVHF